MLKRDKGEDAVADDYNDHESHTIIQCNICYLSSFKDISGIPYIPTTP